MAKEWPAGPPILPVKSPKRRSSEVRLGLVSMAAMVGGLGLMAWVAAEQSKDSRPLYSSKEDCEGEWSDHDCEPSRGNGSGSGSSHGGGSYRGPSVRGYDVDENGKAHRTDMESDRVPKNSRAVTVLRGGFGNSGGRYGVGS